MIRVTQVEEFVSGVPLESSWEKEPGGLGTSSRFGVQEGLPSEMMMRWVLEQNAALIPLPTTTAESAAREHIEAVDFFETVGFEPSLLCLLVDLPQPVVALLVLRAEHVENGDGRATEVGAGTDDCCSLVQVGHMHDEAFRRWECIDNLDCHSQEGA